MYFPRNVLTLLKIFSFSICSFGFIWKVGDSFVTFSAREVGTKIEIKLNPNQPIDEILDLVVPELHELVTHEVVHFLQESIEFEIPSLEESCRGLII